jgi:hypothetical protein
MCSLFAVGEFGSLEGGWSLNSWLGGEVVLVCFLVLIWVGIESELGTEDESRR